MESGESAFSDNSIAMLVMSSLRFFPSKNEKATMLGDVRFRRGRNMEIPFLMTALQLVHEHIPVRCPVLAHSLF